VSVRAAEQEAKAAWMGSEPVSLQEPLLILLVLVVIIEFKPQKQWPQMLRDRERDFVLKYVRTLL
jgi:hypothetical protein